MRGIIVAPLEPMVLGQEFDRLPPHVTLVPPFTLEDEKVDALYLRLGEVAEDWLPLRCYVNEIDYFGDSYDVPVRLLSGMMFGNHIGSVVAVEYCGGTFDRRFTGVDGWTPHITDFEGLDTSDVFKIETFSLLSSLHGAKVAIGNFTKDGYEAAA